MTREELVNLLVKLTIDKARKQDKHPFEILEEVKQLIKQRRSMERQRIAQTVSKEVSVN